MKLAQGQRFGPWTLQGENALGEGGNGEVWLAENSKGITAAIKFLHTENFGTQRETRFRDEIKFLENELNRLGILPFIDSYLPDVSTEQDRLRFSALCPPSRGKVTRPSPPRRGRIVCRLIENSRAGRKENFPPSH